MATGNGSSKPTSYYADVSTVTAAVVQEASASVNYVSETVFDGEEPEHDLPAAFPPDRRGGSLGCSHK